MTTIFSFCIAKGILTYKGLSTAPTTLDWFSGGVLGIALYWIGLYEEQSSRKWKWFFQFDLAPAIGYCTKRASGADEYTVLEVMFCEDCVAVYIMLFTFVTILSAYLFPRHQEVLLVLSLIVINVCILLLWYCELGQRVRARVRGWQCLVHFLDDYGSDAPLAKGYELFGVVGTLVGGFCGIAVIFLPYNVVVYYF